ncbi:sigma-70 family RNA polymerase sigma factor [Maribacter polysiphoniae]|uniref:RNA polymerase sigma-70 factor (ECF subfamily) n=1 Tax=Maribacter polysiphoniae TaxID=429344 RepID=A0A316DWF3_9FLAO|nr:sigma-70 family RNA polymerase sigma factor [Maribacter polysiphoniae]MBD1262220.1 sigma-70 family RNA polymerase sigma factor [Maribacter polysiphoniae]PWK21519.1 RNA polymerase sigma-70 factor (ECF subfamily) [Maribacter polysiphoniae]
MELSKKDRFIQLIDEHKKIIYKIVNSYCPNRVDRKDLEQEIIIQLWSAFDAYNTDYKYSTWMYRIALNVAISFYRKERKWALKRDFIDEVSIFNMETNNLEQELERDHDIKLLQQFINNLNELDKALILLYLDNKKHNEMSEILGISKTNVATKIARIKIKLKKEFEKNRDNGNK